MSENDSSDDPGLAPRREAVKRDMPYQSLMKSALYDAFMPGLDKRPGRKADRAVRRKRRVR